MFERAKEALQIEADSILELIPRVDEHFGAALEMILHCPGRIIVTGMGKSGIIGRKIAATLASTGTPSFFLHPAEAIHGDLGMVTQGDVILAISNSGETGRGASYPAQYPPHWGPHHCHGGQTGVDPCQERGYCP